MNEPITSAGDVMFREYFNPLVLQAAFGGGDKLADTFTLPSS